MKQKIIIPLFVTFLLIFASISLAGPVGTYGKEIILKEKVKISEILAKPADFVGKRVLVSGLVIQVCSKRGCWIELASDKPYEKIQIKVTDGQIVFPMSAMSSTALVEGVVEELKLSREQALRYKKHRAEEQGVAFDPSSVIGPENIYRIRGIGAVIEQ